MATEILVPQLGNEVTEAEVTEWAATVGDSVSAGEIIVVISTTKAALEIEAPCDGTLSEICLLYTSPSPRDGSISRMPSSA